MQEEKQKTRISKDSLRQILKLYKYIKPFQTTFGIGLIFLILSSLANLAFPLLLGQLIDRETEDVFLDDIDQYALLLLAVLLAQAIFSFMRVKLFVNVTEGALASLRQETYRHLIQLPITFFNQRRVGELNSRISSDITQLQETMTTTLAELIRQTIIIVGGIGLMAYTSWKLTLFTLAILPAMVVVAVFFGRFIRKYSKKFQAEVAESNTIVEESLQGIYNVKAFANEFLEVARYSKKTDSVAKTGIKGGTYRAAFSAFMIVGVFGAIVAVIWRAATMIQEGDLDNGSLFSFILYCVFIGGSMAGFADVVARIQKAIGATEELMDILNEEKEDLTPTPNPITNFKGNIHFDNVTFAYPTRAETNVIKNLSLEIKSGEQVALVGPSGAGKSTLVQLVLRFFEPTSGRLSFDGKPATEYGLSELRNQMAVVPQDVLLFGGSIRENIAYGKPDASESEIIEAAKKANAWVFISDFSEGLDTIVGERGVQLSGGQRQRIAIARAVLKDPCILILDEATSALDSESERLVQDALDKLMVGRTSIVIAHRLATVRSSDKIVVIENGELVESGTHTELSSKEEGLYKQLSSMQFTD
ncbi:ATP-binding cassette domain-containing protein [Phaeocystidibacter luteus]|uniref:ATP-binding cassette domain-containing protein n=2 Tax=Phaeocystidibacter luteus TaxID=911197 RepID=A0A6N6RGI9_9FLAO|nr:ATP-binding cassette domain-containing protein [Phaeocystidibacter luteus]